MVNDSEFGVKRKVIKKYIKLHTLKKVYSVQKSLDSLA